MTIVKTQYELDKKCEKSEDDIKDWRIFTLKEVCEDIYSNKGKSKKLWVK